MQKAPDTEPAYTEQRRMEALRLGLNNLEAQMFAESEATIHELRELIDKGCPPPVAFNIVL